jgi:hypothetical protein
MLDVCLGLLRPEAQLRFALLCCPYSRKDACNSEPSVEVMEVLKDNHEDRCVNDISLCGGKEALSNTYQLTGVSYVR